MGTSKNVILAVDDEFIILESLRIQLERNFGDKFILEFADSAEVGLEIINETIADKNEVVLVLTDWMMPGLKGNEFSKIIRDKYPNTKIVMLTGQIDQNVMNDTLEKKLIDKLISKPWSEYQVVDAINELTSN